MHKRNVSMAHWMRGLFISIVDAEEPPALAVDMSVSRSCCAHSAAEAFSSLLQAISARFYIISEQQINTLDCYELID